MSKFVVFLALYAAAVSTVLLVRGTGDGPRQAASSPAASSGYPGLRKVMAEARALLRSEV